MKQDNTKTVKWFIKESGANEPTKNNMLRAKNPGIKENFLSNLTGSVIVFFISVFCFTETLI